MKGFNGKALMGTMLAAVIIAALLGIAQIWLDFLQWDVFIKTLATIGIVGIAAGFLMAVDYDMPGSRQKAMLGAMILLSLAMAGMGIAQIWWAVFAWDGFIKLFGTLIILFALVSFYAAVKEDFGGNKRMRDENYLD